jgi:site-specific recombinase XerD
MKSNILSLNDQVELNFNSILDQYQNFLIEADAAKTTITNHIGCLKKFLAFVTVDVSELKNMHVINYRDYLQDTLFLKASSVNTKLVTVKKFATWLREQGVISVDLFNSVKFIKIQKNGSAPKTLTEKEIWAMLNAVAKSRGTVRDRNAAILQLIFNAGLRVSEVVGLNYSDIQINERSGQVLVRKGKGNKERIVPLNTKIRLKLNTYLIYRFNEKGWRPKDRDPLFVSERKERLSVRRLQSMVSEVAVSAKIDRLKISPHVLRHTFAMRFMEANKDISQLSNLLGHASLDTTAIYLLPSEEQLQLSVEKI